MAGLTAPGAGLGSSVGTLGAAAGPVPIRARSSGNSSGWSTTSALLAAPPGSTYSSDKGLPTGPLVTMRVRSSGEPTGRASSATMTLPGGTPARAAGRSWTTPMT